MATKANLERNTFVRGLITEASPLTFPENASLDEVNMVLNRDGSRQRRLGMDIEPSGVDVSTGLSVSQFSYNNITTYQWENVNNDPTTAFGVVQVGKKLFFLDIFQSVITDNVAGTLTLDTSAIGYNISGNAAMDFASISGNLIVVSKELNKPIAISYNGDDGFDAAEITIEVRDLWGVFDGYEPDERPSTLTTAHKYNLLNQGWTLSKITKSYAGEEITKTLKAWYPKYYNTDGSIKYPQSTAKEQGISYLSGVYREARKIYDQYGFNGNTSLSKSAATAYPSNADVIFFGKKTDGGFDASLINASFLGTTPAAKGKYIINAFDRGADRVRRSGVGGLDSDKDSGNISSVASYAGRIFYSGVDSSISEPTTLSPDYAGTLFYSQVIENLGQLGKCYQEADPTSEDISDLIATDGGTIKIPEAGTILRLVRNGSSLVVIADNGVWEISGPDGVFAADDYSINQTTTAGAISKSSIVVAGDTVMYWSTGGIYALTPDQASGRLAPTNISETTIQKFYNGISSVGRANSVGNYDDAGRKITWLFNDKDGYDGITYRKSFNKELVFDVVLQAFYVHEIQEGDYYVAGYLPTMNFLTALTQQDVVVNGEPVVVNGEQVVITSRFRSRGETSTKYLVWKAPDIDGSTFYISAAYYHNTDFKDWDTTDAAAYLVTGQEIFQDTQRNKQINNLATHFLMTETGFSNGELLGTSSCLVSVRWDFASSAASGKWSTARQMYRLPRFYTPATDDDGNFAYGQEVLSTKDRPRGSGKAISLKFETEPEKDLYLLGWGMAVLGQERE